MGYERLLAYSKCGLTQYGSAAFEHDTIFCLEEMDYLSVLLPTM